MEGPGADFQLQRRWLVFGRTSLHLRLPSIFESPRSQTEAIGALLTQGTLYLAPHESIAPSTSSGGGLVVAQWPHTHRAVTPHPTAFSAITWHLGCHCRAGSPGPRPPNHARRRRCWAGRLWHLLCSQAGVSCVSLRAVATWKTVKSCSVSGLGPSALHVLCRFQLIVLQYPCHKTHRRKERI